MSKEQPTIGEVAPLMSGISEGRLGFPREATPPIDKDTGRGLWQRAADHIGIRLDEYIQVTMDFAALQALGHHKEIQRRLADMAGIEIAEFMAMDTDDMLTELEGDEDGIR